MPRRHRHHSRAARFSVGIAVAASLAAFATLSGQSAHAADQQVERRGSVLKVEWRADSEGTWELRDSQGNVCAAGRSTGGENKIQLDKVAAPTDLSLLLKGEGTTAPTVVGIPGVRRLSPLPKPDRAATIYQLPPRSFMAKGLGAEGSGRLTDLTAERLQEIKDLGVDYLWLTGVIEHAARNQTDPDVVKGGAGSYYAIYDNWDVSNQIGSLADIEALIDRAHTAGLRVLIDFVANHTARVHRTDVVCKSHLDFGVQDRTGDFFDPNNNYYYIQNTSFAPPAQNGVDGADGAFDTDFFTPGIQPEAPARVTGNDIISASPQIYDWFETVKLNYGWDLETRRAHYNPRPRTWDQMLDVARYWVEKGVDGFRVDFAHAVPIEFWRFFAAELRRVQPSVFLLAEAYESDHGMMLPGFSYRAMLEAGFDSVYDSELYWAMHNQVRRVDMRTATPGRSPAAVPAVVEQGFQFTRYQENHDEMRLASRHFAPWIGDRGQRARLGLAYTTWLGLMPGNLMIHGGQELQEDATIFGNYQGDNGRTSIFDFIYQSQTRTWWYGTRPAWMTDFRERYRSLLGLKRAVPFNLAHKSSAPTLFDLDYTNGGKVQAQWIASYVRAGGGAAYLVVTNADPFEAHEATIHFTSQDGADSLGLLRALGIQNDERRWKFTEVFSQPGWSPRDPAVDGEGMPGWALHRAGNIPSGLFLGQIPAATTFVFRIEAL